MKASLSKHVVAKILLLSMVSKNRNPFFNIYAYAGKLDLPCAMCVLEISLTRT